MALFNPKEHLSCHHYAQKSDCGWLYLQSSAKKAFRGIPEHHFILFCSGGQIQISVGDNVYDLTEGTMKFLPRGSATRLKLVEERTELIVAYFDQINFLCDRITMQQLSDLKKSTPYNPNPMEVRGALSPLLDSIRVYLQDKALCAYLHELKVRELFWCLRSYYQREELTSFFYPILGATRFRDDVLNTFTCNIKVNDLAARLHMSGSTFYKKFRTEFGVSPEQWIRMQSNKQILFIIQDSELSIGEIADRLHFNSQATFTRYCRSNFGLTPTQIREKLKNAPYTDALFIEETAPLRHP